MSNKFSTVEQQASYGIGRQMGNQLVASSFEGLEIEAVQLGLADAFANKESQVDMEVLREAFNEITRRLQVAQEAAAEAAIAEGKAFLEENAKREGVFVTESGLQYEIVNQGEGATPTAADKVRTHYHGTFLNGEVFDSSVVREEPVEFPVSGVIAGWTEALQMMPAGSKWKLYVPQDLAYGEKGAGEAIPPYSTLVFEVELLDVL